MDRLRATFWPTAATSTAAATTGGRAPGVPAAATAREKGKGRANEADEAIDVGWTTADEPELWGPLNGRRLHSTTRTAAGPPPPPRTAATEPRGGVGGTTGASAGGGEDYVAEVVDKDGRKRRMLHHLVLPSDTLQGLAIQYSVTVDELRRTNKLWTNDSVHLRKILLIPLDGASSLTAYTPPTLRSLWGVAPDDHHSTGAHSVDEGDNEAGSSRSRTASSASSASIPRLGPALVGVNGRSRMVSTPASSPGHGGGPEPWTVVVHGDGASRTARGAVVDDRLSVPSTLDPATTPARSRPVPVVEDRTGTWMLNMYGVWQQLKPDDERLRQQRERMEHVENDLLQL